MPTPTGLPRAGEVWKRTSRLPPDWKPHVIRFHVLSRSAGSYFALRVKIISINGEPPKPPHNRAQLWVDAAYWLSKGELEFVHA